MQSFGTRSLVGVEIGGWGMQFISRHWTALLSIFPFLPALGRLLKPVLQWAGDLDLVISRIEDPDWMGIVMWWFLDPPPWVILPALIVGFLLIGADIWRGRRRRSDLTINGRDVLAVASRTAGNTTPAMIFGAIIALGGITWIASPAKQEVPSTSPVQPAAPSVLKRSYLSAGAKGRLEDDLDSLNRTLSNDGQAVVKGFNALLFAFAPSPPFGSWPDWIAEKENKLATTKASFSKLKSTIWGQGQLLSHGDTADDLKDVVGSEQAFSEFERKLNVFDGNFTAFKRILARGDPDSINSAFTIARAINPDFSNEIMRFDSWTKDCIQRIANKRRALSEVK
jgi:hypothetical protein